MAIRQSDWALGRKQAPTSREARGVVVERFDFAVTEALEAGDIVELAILPAYHRIASATLVPQGDFADVTADVGIMSGAVGSLDPTRTSGDELFSGEAMDKVSSISTSPALLMDAADRDRSIGVKLSGSVTPGGQVISLVLFTYQ